MATISREKKGVIYVEADSGMIPPRPVGRW